MAEGFELYHVPHQTRRDKLRVGIVGGNNNINSNIHNHNFHIPSGLLPLHEDPSSLISSDFDFHPISQNPSFQLHHHNSYNYCPPLLPTDQPLSLELNLQQRYASATAGDFNFAYSPSILKGSKFFKPAQKLLLNLFHSDNISSDSPLLDPLLEFLGDDIPAAAVGYDPVDGADSRGRNTRLVTMLHEVYKRYKLYYQQIEAVITTFEYAAGLGNAAPFVNLAVKSMLKHFRLLKNAIAEQLRFNTHHHKQPFDNAAFLDPQLAWRPQRGLPESAVTVLRAWLFEHFLHPYPSDTDKLVLANRTGLSRSQVSNWFINARVRLWKPMVEEIYMLETRQAQKTQQRESNNNGNELSESMKADHNNNASSSTHSHHQLNLSSSNFLLPIHHHHSAVGAATIGSGNVSLTLGLHQNRGRLAQTEPFPINNAAQHFNLGLEANGEGFVNEWF